MKTIGRMRAACLRAAATLSVLCTASLAIADDVTIADIAPRQSAFVFGVDDCAAMKTAFDRTGLRSIWDEPSVQKWFHEATREMTEQLTEMLETIDADREDLTLPSGPAGGAVWMVEQAEPTDPPFAFIVMGDFGEDAATMHDMLVSGFDEGEEKERIRVDHEEFAGTTIYTIEQLEVEAEDNEEMGDEEDEWDDLEGWEEPAQPRFEKMYYARVGSRLIGATDSADLENAIERIGGKKLESVRDVDEFHAARSQVGAHDGYAVVLTGSLFKMMDESAKRAAEEYEMAAPEVMTMLNAFGVSNVHALSMGMKLDADDGMMVTRYGVLAEKLSGILSLFDVAPASFEPPAFVSADATSFTMMQFDLARLIPTLQEVSRALPAQESQQLGMVLGMAAGFVGPVLDQLSPEIYWAQTYARPFSVESQKTLVAIKAKDANALSQAMGGTAANLGLTSRDFQGSQIWSAGEGGGMMGGMLPISGGSIGIGGGHMFIGPENDVENALRQAAQDGAPALAKDDRFQQALDTTKGKGFSFSYTNLPRTLDYMKWYMDNYESIAKQQIEQMLGDVDDPELRAWYEENQPEMPAWMDDLPDLSLIAKHVGDSVTEFHRADDGMRGRTVWMRPN